MARPPPLKAPAAGVLLAPARASGDWPEGKDRALLTEVRMQVPAQEGRRWAPQARVRFFWLWRQGFLRLRVLRRFGGFARGADREVV